MLDTMVTAPTVSKERLGLVVEDKADTRAWLGRIMGQAFVGIETHAVPTRGAALAWIQDRGRRLKGDADGSHIALIDLGLPDGSGVEIIRELSSNYPSVVPIVTTIYDDDTHLFDAIAAGAKGYLLKDQHADTLVGYLHRIEHGEPPLSPSIARRMLEHFSTQAARLPAAAMPEAGLTPRELDVLRLLGRGLRIHEAARVLGLTPHTVAGYVKVIYRKLNITSRAEAAIEAVRRGLV